MCENLNRYLKMHLEHQGQDEKTTFRTCDPLDRIYFGMPGILFRISRFSAMITNFLYNLLNYFF